MPTSVRDRLSCTYEVVYFATRNQQYYFDLDVIRIPHRSLLSKPSVAAARRAVVATRPEWAGPLAGSNVGLDRTKASGRVGHPLGKNPGDVWQFATSSWHAEHHALFPESLVTRPILATCPEKVCSACGAPWERARADRSKRLVAIGELRPACDHNAGTRPGLVLDPFIGAGTTALVAERHGRDWLGIELRSSFATAAVRRIEAERDKRTNERRSTREPPMAA